MSSKRRYKLLPFLLISILVCIAVSVSVMLTGCGKNDNGPDVSGGGDDDDKIVAVKIADIGNITLGYYSNDRATVDLSEYVNANGTTVTYAVRSSDTSVVEATENGGTLTVTAKSPTGSATVTVEVLSDGERAFELSCTVNVTDDNAGSGGDDEETAKKIADIANVTLGYYSNDRATVDLSEYVNANGTTVTYAVRSSDTSVVEAIENGGTLTVTAKSPTGSATVTVEVLSDGERAFDLSFQVTVTDNKITKTNNYSSFTDAGSWQYILNDVNEDPNAKVWYDAWTNSCILQWNNAYQQIGPTSHISFELWVNAAGNYGFELWLRSTTNDKNVVGSKYVMNGYGDSITVSREDNTLLASFPRFTAGEFTRFDITFFDEYVGGVPTKTVVGIYVNGNKVAGFNDTNPIAKEAGVYFGYKSWEPQIAIREAEAVSEPNPYAKRVACVGDSITYGHAWHNESYPVYLAGLLGDDYVVENYGHNGASVTGFGGSYEKYANLTEYNGSLNFAPDIIVIMLGSNDANGWANAQASYESDLRALINAYKTAYPALQIVLVTSPPTLDNNAYGIPRNVVKNSVNPIQREVAADMGLTLVDLFSAIEGQGDYGSFYREGDGVHLSVTGANFVANIIAEAIESLN